jgi:hypothetical protein
MRIMSTLLPLSNLINYCFRYVIETSSVYKIDESHALKHSMEVFEFSKKIYETELLKNPYLKDQQKIIFTAAIGHDMCDKKYMNETDGILKYKIYLSNHMPINDIEVMGKIIETMSYSKVKKNGYPDLGKYQLAYHIVREADLLSSYDIDRCIIYGMYIEKLDYDKALKRAVELFKNRELKYINENLFITDFSKNKALEKHKNAEEHLKDIVF